MKTRLRTVFGIMIVSLLMLVALPLNSEAAPIILSSFMGDSGNHETWGVAGGNGSNALAASTFRTDGFSYLLDSITVKLRSEHSYDPIPELSIYTNNSPFPQRPGTQIGILTGPSGIPHTDTYHNYTFTAQGINLNPFSFYWVVLKSLTGDMEWYGSYACNYPLSGWTGVGFFPDVTQSLDGGQTWDEDWTGIYQGALCMTVIADPNPAPEPATILLLGPGIAWMVRRRFKK